MNLPNMDLREYALKNRVRMWRVAQYLGISDNKLYRDLRKEQDEIAKATFKQVVDILASQDEGK